MTHLVQQLEARLRVRLLNRTTRKLNVTPDGIAYYKRVTRLLADMDDAETSLSSALAAPRGRLRVDVPSPLARLLLILALPDFFARYPDIQLDLGVSDRTVDIFGENVDCVVRGGDPKDQSMIARRVAELPLGVFASPGYLAMAGVPSHPDVGGGRKLHRTGGRNLHARARWQLRKSLWSRLCTGGNNACCYVTIWSKACPKRRLRGNWA